MVGKLKGRNMEEEDGRGGLLISWQSRSRERGKELEKMGPGISYTLQRCARSDLLPQPPSPTSLLSYKVMNGFLIDKGSTLTIP